MIKNTKLENDKALLEQLYIVDRLSLTKIAKNIKFSHGYHEALKEARHTAKNPFRRIF